jgi:hypothetical protein
MLPRFHGFAKISAIALSLVLAVEAGAAPKSWNTDKSAIPDGEHDSPVGSLATVFGTGWEAADGFALGAVEPQLGWTATSTNNTWASVSAASPFAGARHMRLIRNTLLGQGSQCLVFTPTVAQAPGTPATIKMQVKISNDQGADYDVIAQAPSQGFLTWRVKFSFSDIVGTGPGTIFILDDVGSGLAFQDTGVLWDINVYRELKVQFDPGAGQIRYYYDGNLIYTGILVAATAVEQIVWRTDNFQLGGETGDFDAALWTDTPSDPVPAIPQSFGGLKSKYRQ